MERKRKLFWAKTGVILSVVPVILWAHEYGPDAGYSGVPGEVGEQGPTTNDTCLSSSCHVGTLNPSAGKVTVAFPNGTTYTPGVKQHLMVTISDSTGPRAWGFQLTARQASSSKTMAGSFGSTDNNTLVLCADTSLFTEQELDYPNSQTCPSSKPLAFIEHSLTGYQKTLGMTGSATYQFDWTPPASAVGNITIYVAANSGPATSSPTQTGADVYTATYTLTPAAANPNAPTITDVQNGASFQPGVVPGSWITIKGSHLSATTDTWDNFIANGKLPTNVDGVTVNVGGQPAYVYYVSDSQINALVGNIGTGTMAVTVNNTNGSATANGNSASVQPALFLWNNKYAVATHNTPGCTPQPYCTWAAGNGTFAGVTTTPAAPGETIIIWGTAFGPTNPPAPVGVPVPAQTFVTTNPVSVTINGTAAAVYQNQGFLAPTSAGEYQIAVTVPTNAPDGDLPIVATVNGAQSPTGVFLTVHH
jgi:uncharacterized protein (TIGR03437 family)